MAEARPALDRVHLVEALRVAVGVLFGGITQSIGSS